MALGKQPIINGVETRVESVEDRINGLAMALGIPSKELASAIAGLVRQYVPPASLSSIVAKETGEVVESLLKAEKMPAAMNLDDELD
jgi:hypothetical protein